MIADIIITLSACLVIEVSGLMVLSLLQKHPFNSYLRYSIAWVLGNLFFVVLLTMLASLELLSLGPWMLVSIGLAEVVYGCTLWVRGKIKVKLHLKKEAVLIGLVVVGISAGVLLYEFWRPLDLWDARAIWVMKAKAFYLSNGFNNSFMTNSLYAIHHNAYPNGLSLMMSLFFRLYSTINEHALRFYLVLFYANSILMTVGVLKHFFGSIRWYIVALFIVSCFVTWIPTYYAISGYAEMPIGLAFQGSVVCLVLAIETKTLSSRLELVGIALLSTILAVHTKSEGLPFLLIISICSVFLIAENRRAIGQKVKSHLSKIVLFGTVLGLALASIFLWRFSYAQVGIPSDIPFSFAERSLFSIYHSTKVIAYAFIEEAFTISHWGLLIPTMILFLIGGTATLFRYRELRRYTLPFLIIFLQVCIYFLIYLFSKNDIYWHLNTSLARLFFQLMPALVCVSGYYASVFSRMLRINERMRK